MSVVRALEFTTLNCWWDSNAYGSIVWVLLGVHTAHLLTDVVDPIVLAALMFTAHAEPKRCVDVSENSLYWHFIDGVWVLMALAFLTTGAFESSGPRPSPLDLGLAALALATGLYVYSVEDLDTKEYQRGKFLVVKSDREN